MSTKGPSEVDALVAERIRAYRRQSGLTQDSLAKKLGITFQQVQKYEKAVNRIGAGRLFEIAAIFKIPIQALYPDSEETVEHIQSRTEEAREIADFFLSVDGWKLCRAFLQITDPAMRKAIVTLVQELTRK